MSPELMQFTIKPAASCRGCLFDGQHSNVCSRACDAASHAGLPWCEEGFIYVSKDEDPRQMDLLKQEN
jgi:hypothetical protein